MDSINLLNELDSISKVHTLKRDDIDNLIIEFAQRILATLKIERIVFGYSTKERMQLFQLENTSCLEENLQKNTPYYRKNILTILKLSAKMKFY
mgnify:CR=1 FL=1